MRSWISTDVELLDSRRLVRFTIPMRHFMRIADGLSKSHPDALANTLRSIITEARPELADCGIFSMTWNYQLACFETLVWHISFDPATPYEEIRQECLESDGETWRTREQML